MHSIDAGSQVCNVLWSKHSNELVSTHGYSQNQIIVWQYPGLQQVARLTGHSYRVLYLVRPFVNVFLLVSRKIHISVHVARRRVHRHGRRR